MIDDEWCRAPLEASVLTIPSLHWSKSISNSLRLMREIRVSERVHMSGFMSGALLGVA